MSCGFHGARAGFGWFRSVRSRPGTHPARVKQRETERRLAVGVQHDLMFINPEFI